MRVTQDMTTEAGGPLDRLADFIGWDETGIKVTQYGDHISVEADSTCWPSKTVRLDLDDAEALADLIRQRVAEARGGVIAP